MCSNAMQHSAHLRRQLERQERRAVVKIRLVHRLDQGLRVSTPTLQTSQKSKNMNLSGCGQAFRLGTAAAMITALEHAREVTIPSLKVPFCVCHGSDDRSVPISGTEYLLEHSKTPVSDREFRKEEGSYHDILAEKTAEDTVTFVLDWILERCNDGKWRLGDM